MAVGARTNPDGYTVTVGSAGQESLALRGRGLVKAAPTQEILEAPIPVLSKESLRIESSEHVCSLPHQGGRDQSQPVFNGESKISPKSLVAEH